MALRDEIREQQKTLAGKGFKYKLDYFLEYYKWATLGVIIGIIVLFSFIKSIVTAKDDAFFAACINAIAMPSQEAFADYIGIDTKKEEVVFDTTFSIQEGSSDQSSYLSLQKLMATIAGKTTDIIIGDKAAVENLANNQFYLDLREVYSQDFLDSLGDKVYYIEYTDEDGNVISEPTPVLIDISDSPLLNANVFFVSDVSFGIIANAPHIDYCKKFYEFLYDESVLEAASVPTTVYY